MKGITIADGYCVLKEDSRDGVLYATNGRKGIIYSTLGGARQGRHNGGKYALVKVRVVIEEVIENEL